ncbi:MAG: helix-turn-helix domain-containing protein [Hyalangium sp.]
MECQLIESPLRRCGNHRDRAAKQLSLARSSLFKRLKERGVGGVGEGEQ